MTGKVGQGHAGTGSEWRSAEAAVSIDSWNRFPFDRNPTTALVGFHRVAVRDHRRGGEVVAPETVRRFAVEKVSSATGPTR